MSDEHSDNAADRCLPPVAPPHITPREKEILGLIAEGLTDRAIAERLWVSRNTVNTHLVHLREKLQVHNRTALVREAERQGLLSPRSEESRVLAIGEEAHLGYTPDQEAAPKPSPEQTGGDASAEAPGETEMLNPRLRFWYLAALLAVGAENGAAAEAANAAPRSRATVPDAVVNAQDTAAGMVARRVWTGPGVDGAVKVFIGKITSGLRKNQLGRRTTW